MEVLPLVPVTAAIVRGCRPWKRAARRASRRCGFGSTRIATRSRDCGVSASAWASSVRIATAPCATASAANARPSRRVPGKAAKRKPGRMVRESALRPTISGSGPGLGVTPASSVSFKPLALKAVYEQRALHFGRCFVDGLHSENGRNPRDDAAGRRSYGPARGCIAVALLVGMWFVDHRQDKILRGVDREDPDKARQHLSIGVMPARNLVRRPRLSTDDVARGGCHCAGPAFNHQAHQSTHLVRGLRRNHLLTLGSMTGGQFDESSLPEHPAIDERGSGGRKAQRGHGNPVTKGDGHHIDFAPFGRIVRFSHFRDLDLRFAQQTKPREKLSLLLTPGRDSHLGGPNI